MKHPSIPEPSYSPRLHGFDRDDLQKEEQIGRGGVASVYLGTVEHRGRELQIAIKEPRFEGAGGDGVERRFEGEAEILREISDHENIVSLFSWGTEPLPWLASEFVGGGTLESKIGSVDVEEALWIAARIAEGVWYSHEHGVAHLDLKPSNVLLQRTGRGEWDYPKICDWGLARKFLKDSSEFEGFSPTHAAPEQFDSENYGRLNDFTDIYQVGNIVYALLTGEPPFSGSSQSLKECVLNDEPAPPSTINPEVPIEVDQVVLKALSKEQIERYESMLSFRRKLDRLFAEIAEERAPKKQLG